MKSAKQPRPLQEVAPAEEVSPLSPQCAFVVQFREGTWGEYGPFAGRVEHINSGHAAHFHSVEELLAVIRRILDDVGA